MIKKEEVKIKNMVEEEIVDMKGMKMRLKEMKKCFR